MQPLYIYIFIIISGASSLSWEVIWQIKSSLALGVSAHGTALTLAITMGGMGCGALIMGWLLRSREPQHPLRLYGALEAVIAIAGLLLEPAFRVIEKLDTSIYASAPHLSVLTHIAGIVSVLLIPAMAMGATLPVFGLIARQFSLSLARLYSFNTLGAALGTLLVAFVFIPLWGIAHTIWLVAALNIFVACVTWLPLLRQGVQASRPYVPRQSNFFYIIDLGCRYSARLLGPGGGGEKPMSLQTKILIVAVTGFAVLTLEVAWFRAMTAAFLSTTYAFAIMLSSVLIALGQAAGQVAYMKKQKIPLGSVLAWAGIFILLTTPLIERLDIFLIGNNRLPGTEAIETAAVETAVTAGSAASNYYLLSMMTLLTLFIISYVLVSVSMRLLGVALPWILDEETVPRRWGLLYGLNTIAAIIGSISAAWIFLPVIGFARTAWLAGFLVLAVGVFVTSGRRRKIAWAVLGVAALVAAFMFESGAGTTRALGAKFYSADGSEPKLIESHEGPDATVSVIEESDGGHRLLIDGTSASGEAGREASPGAHYLGWMGTLPMIAHPRPENALVICFGTGQTANAVRVEEPQSLDIVDINKNVFKVAHHFSSNHSVLLDKRVKQIVMDGRAYLRRSRNMYDVITLEPMPPNLAGVNALYSREFYELARTRLKDNGIIAQWLPYDNITPFFAASIARTFQDVFPNAVLWNDPVAPVGILLGSKDDAAKLGSVWPGFARLHASRNLSEREVRKSVVFDRAMLAAYADEGAVITDDNQLLAYGLGPQSLYNKGDLLQENMLFLDHVGKKR